MPPHSRVLTVARKELRTLLRDRFYLFMGVTLPLITMITLGFGMNYDVRDVPLGVADQDRSLESRSLAQAFANSGYFREVTVDGRPAALDRALDAGRIRASLTIPHGFGRTLRRGRPAEVQVLIDGSIPMRAEIIRGYVEAIMAQYNRDRLATAVQRTPGRATAAAGGVDVVRRVWFNPNLDSRSFLIPGLLVLSLLFWAPLLVSLSVTREKETGAMLNVQTAPLARWEYVAGKLIPYGAVTLLSYFLLLAAAVVLFGIPVKGSAVVLTGAVLIYVLAMTGLGLLVSMLVRTQVAALMAMTMIAFAVGAFYSGWDRPVSALSAPGRAMSRLLPTADLMTIARGVFLKGLGFEAYQATLMVLGAYAVVLVILPVLAFRKRRR